MPVFQWLIKKINATPLESSKEAMPRGSRPGERRGGRKKGTPNKTTLWRGALVAELAKNPKVEPLELFLRLMRTPLLPLALRIDVAQLALPYCHSRLRPQRTSEDLGKMVGHDRALQCGRRNKPD